MGLFPRAGHSRSGGFFANSLQQALCLLRSPTVFFFLRFGKLWLATLQNKKPRFAVCELGLCCAVGGGLAKPIRNGGLKASPVPAARSHVLFLFALWQALACHAPKEKAPVRWV